MEDDMWQIGKALRDPAHSAERQTGKVAQ
jgi:hypothetical protein